MEFLALFLAALAFLLAVPVPRLLHQASFRVRSPWTAMLLWQSIALAGGLSLVGAPMIYGLAPFGDSLLEAVVTVLRLLTQEDFAALEDLDVHPTHIFALCLGVLIGGHLLLTLARTYIRVLNARRRHRQLVGLLSTPLAQEQDPETAHLVDTHIIEHDAPLAYCLPGRTNASSVTVLSRGLLVQLSEAELAAVVAHEKTHLAQRHHLLTMAFEAWYRALPWLPTTRYGREAVLELTEMLADDGALAESSREDLLRSIATTGSGEDQPSPDAAAPQAQGGLITGARLQRLLLPPAPLTRTASLGIASSALALLAIPTGLILIS